jgi:hypothetical protein
MILIKLAIGIISTSLIGLMLYVIGRITIHGIDPKETTHTWHEWGFAITLGLLAIGIIATVAYAMIAIGHIVMHIIG